MAELATIIGAVSALFTAVFAIVIKFHNSQIQDLRKDRNKAHTFQERMLSIISDTNSKVVDLQCEVGELKTEIATWACYKPHCKLRKVKEENDTSKTKKNSKKG